MPPHPFAALLMLREFALFLEAERLREAEAVKVNDLAGNRLSVVYDAGAGDARTLNSSYDALNRVANITDVQSGGNRTSGYRYDLAGHRLQLVEANGGNITTAFDALGRQTSITGHGNTSTTDYTFALSYDQYNNLAEQAEGYPGNLTGTSNRTVTLGYDNDNRLTGEAIVRADSGGNLTTTFTYDNANNRLTQHITRAEKGSGFKFCSWPGGREPSTRLTPVIMF